MVRRVVTSQRFYEILVPVVTWLIITTPVWLSPFFPALVAYFIIVFDVYFFYKTFKTVVLATISYMRIKQANKINWYKRARFCASFDEINHVIIVTNYKETKRKLRITLDAIAKQRYAKNHIHIVLAMEEAEGMAAHDRAKKLISEYMTSVASITATFHPLKPGEEKGKASNETWAARAVSYMVAKKKWDPKNIIVTSCDADSVLDNQYLAYVTYQYLTDRNAQYKFYWAPLLLYSNYWKLNFFIRIQTTISSIMRLAFLSETSNLIQISTYSMSLWLLEQVDYWDVDIIPEDWHIFLQAFVKFGSVVETKPVYLITTGDGVSGKNFVDSIRNRYEQEKRWAWGVTDIPYAIQQFAHASHISIVDRFFRILSVLQTHILWPSSFFVLTLGATVPMFLNPYFKQTALGYLLPKVAGSILTMTTSFVLIIAVLDFQSKRHFLNKREMPKVPLLMLQWILFPILSPIISALLSSLPALESHTRMLLGKKIDYKVTKKS